MTARDRKLHEYRLRQEIDAASDGEAEAAAEPDAEARERRAEHQAWWVEQRIQAAMARGEFDDLPLAGKPIPGIDQPHDPDWWIRRLVERERISALPPALGLRTEHASMDDTLDALSTEQAVRGHLEDYNARIVDARRQLQGGPPVITPLRDLDLEVTRWRSRRRARAESRSAEQAMTPRAQPRSRLRRWFSRGDSVSAPGSRSGRD